MQKEIAEIVPLDATIDASLVKIYQLNKNGDVELLSNYNGLPSDENYLNEFLGAFNESFIQLIEIEDKCDKFI